MRILLCQLQVPHILLMPSRIVTRESGAEYTIRCLWSRKIANRYCRTSPRTLRTRYSRLFWRYQQYNGRTYHAISSGSRRTLPFIVGES